MPKLVLLIEGDRRTLVSGPALSIAEKAAISDADISTGGKLLPNQGGKRRKMRKVRSHKQERD